MKHHPSSLTHHVPVQFRARAALVDPVKIETTDVVWRAIRTAHASERRVADDLSSKGLRAYCPLGRRLVYFEHGRRTARGIVKQFPVFARYLFVGLPPNVGFGKWTNDKIEAVLRDSNGPLSVPAAAITALNDLELAGEWDETRSFREKSPFQPGTRVFISKGPFADFRATVDALLSESRILVLVDIFGRQSASELDTCQVRAC